MENDYSWGQYWRFWISSRNMIINTQEETKLRHENNREKKTEVTDKSRKCNIQITGREKINEWWWDNNYSNKSKITSLQWIMIWICKCLTLCWVGLVTKQYKLWEIQKIKENLKDSHIAKASYLISKLFFFINTGTQG